MSWSVTNFHEKVTISHISHVQFMTVTIIASGVDVVLSFQLQLAHTSIAQTRKPFIPRRFELGNAPRERTVQPARTGFGGRRGLHSLFQPGHLTRVFR